jgi:hypothetical protein
VISIMLNKYIILDFMAYLFRIYSNIVLPSTTRLKKISFP